MNSGCSRAKSRPAGFWRLSSLSRYRIERVQVSCWMARNDTRVVPYGLRPLRVRIFLEIYLFDTFRKSIFLKLFGDKSSWKWGFVGNDPCVVPLRIEDTCWLLYDTIRGCRDSACRRPCGVRLRGAVRFYRLIFSSGAAPLRMTQRVAIW